MYLLGRMPGRTTLVLSGRSYGLVSPTCELARNLQPSMVMLEDVGTIVARTDGTSASFIKELLRRATLLAAEEWKELVVTDRHAFEALDELLVAGGTLTMHLLGASHHRTHLPEAGSRTPTTGHQAEKTRSPRGIRPLKPELPRTARGRCGASCLRWVLRGHGSRVRPQPCW
jgi:hypothetical protein